MNNITLTIPNDDHIALRAFGKALEEMALAHGAQPRQTTVGELSYKVNIDTTEALERLNAATGELMQAAPRMLNELRFEVDTTAQQVESLAVSVEANGATYETDLGSDNPQPAPVADSTGTPWDERIHSASKALNADGTWRLRRKPKDMDEVEWAALIESVKGELSDTQLSDSEFVVDPYDTYEEGELPQVVVVEPPVTPPGDDFDVVTEETVAGIPPLPVPPPVVVAPPVPEVTEWDFPRLMTFLTERHGKIDVATVNTLLAQDGLASLQELNAHPDKIGPFVARVKAHLGE